LVLFTLCGQLRAASGNHTMLERLGSIIEMGQRVVKGMMH
jgi:hypothetical protein